MGGGGQLKKLPVVYTAFTCGLFIKLYKRNKNNKLTSTASSRVSSCNVSITVGRKHE
jgi:hypothetical protein